MKKRFLFSLLWIRKFNFNAEQSLILLISFIIQKSSNVNPGTKWIASQILNIQIL